MTSDFRLSISDFRFAMNQCASKDPHIENRKSQIRSRKSSRGQALIEIFFVVLLFFFVGLMGYETAVLYYNVNQVNNALKQAVWVASMGATDEEIITFVTDVDSWLLKSAFMEHIVDDFAIEMWVQTPTGEVNIAPTALDANFTPGTFNPATARRAAYIWRAQGLNIRLGLNYKIGYVSPYFGATPVFMVNIPLAASQPVIARNDEDHDGLVDIYERELWVQYSGTIGYIPLSHTDTWVNSATDTTSDKFRYDVDRDGRADTSTEEMGFGMYDYDNDGILDPFDPGTNHNWMRHPKLGGRPLSGF